MEKQLSQLTTIKHLRQFLLQQVDGLTTAQLNAIPPGYHNNIIWHLAHLNSAVQAICYVLSGQPIALDEQYFRPFLPGTRPERALDETEIEVVKGLLIATIDQLRTDVERGIFTTYKPSERIAAVYGVEVASLADALDFILFHEGYHIGYVVALKHLV
ncbi:MAG: DinB family protein [Janthinobacterium lividum]